ncbi:MAG: glycosyltransferase [Flavobacteriales bacterium]|nr:glycosyltransferase [Flavobacteriales bacterium]
MKDLWLFTTRFPYGHNEPFLENELPFLSQRFRRIRIVPLIRDEGIRPLPSNVEVMPPPEDPYRSASPWLVLRYARTWSVLRSTVRASAPSDEVLRRRWPEARAAMRQAIQRMHRMRLGLFKDYDPEQVVLYSYWMADQATALSLMRLVDPRVRFLARMHGYDLFAERWPDAWSFFQMFQMTQVERLFIVSQAGKDYLTHRYPERADSCELARLGTFDHGPGPWSPSDTLRIVSCSHIVPLKPVTLLAEVLRHVRRPVRWTHFGEGPERPALERAVRALPSHVNVSLPGNVANQQLLAWYRTEPVDLFVHLSSTEGGVPVSMQEATSFGIPLLAADAGGVREIVGPATGTLLPHDPEPLAIAALLDAFQEGPQHTAEFRAGVRAAWSAGFKAEVNFGHFCDRLLHAAEGRA